MLDWIWTWRELFPVWLNPARMGSAAAQHGWNLLCALTCSGVICSPGTQYSLISIMPGAGLGWTMKLLHPHSVTFTPLKSSAHAGVHLFQKSKGKPWTSLLLGFHYSLEQTKCKSQNIMILNANLQSPHNDS